MFIRAKRQGERTYYYAVKSERLGGRVKQRTVAYLGEYSTIEEALLRLPQVIAKLNEDARRYSVKADAIRGKMNPVWIDRNGGEVPKAKRTGAQPINRMFNHYWLCHGLAVAFERRARLETARLKKLKTALCSA